MKTLIRHLLNTNMQEIVDKSLLNCHVIGLHSIMLLEAPGKRIRLYVTTPDHQLAHNYYSPQTLAYHPHHCDLTLHMVFGEMTNIVVKESNEAPVDKEAANVFNKWLYTSQISTGNKMGFELVGKSIISLYDKQLLTAGESVFMMAKEIHTVAVPKETSSAWLVYEGSDDADYQPFAWSNKDLSNTDNAGLYKKPTFPDILHLLRSVKLTDIK